MTIEEFCEAINMGSARVAALSPVEYESHYKSINQTMRDIDAKHDKMEWDRRVTTEVLNRVCDL